MALFSTRDTIDLLNAANPDRPIDEDTVRVALRRGRIAAPGKLAGRFAWTAGDVEALAAVLSLKIPSFSGTESEVQR